MLRFAPNIQVARDGRLGDRLISDDKKNFAPRIGWAWNPSEKWSFRAGTGIFYMQDTGNPRFDMARNLSGRRRDNTLLLTPDLTFDAPFRGGRHRERLRRGAAAGLPVERLRAGQHAGSQDAVHVPVSLQRPARARRLDRARSRLPRLPQLSSGADVRLERNDSRRHRIGAEPEAVSRVHEGPGDRQRRGGQVQLARGQADAAAARRIVGAGRLYVLEVDGQRQRHPHARMATRCSRRTASASTASGDCRCSTCAIGSSRRSSTSCRSAPGSRSWRPASARAILGGWQVSTILTKSSGFPRTAYVGTDRSNTGGGQDRPNVTGQDPILPGDQQTIARWFNTDAFVVERRRAPGATPAATRSSARASPTWTASIIRNFRLSSSKTLQFRLEAFNALNNPIWNDPNTTLTSPLYGTINSTRKPMRELQLGLKFVF